MKGEAKFLLCTNFLVSLKRRSTLRAKKTFFGELKKVGGLDFRHVRIYDTC
jgi:hypothetical protein